MQLLGAQIDVHLGSISASLPSQKASALISDLEAVARRGRLTPDAAANLRGRLGFAQSLLFGRVGRAHLAPFSDRQYSRTECTRYPLNEDLRDAIRRWVKTLKSPVPRSVSFAQRKPALVYTDACGTGHIGAVVIINGTTHCVSTHLPARFASARDKITEYELVATVLGIVVARHICPGTPVLLC